MATAALAHQVVRVVVDTAVAVPVVAAGLLWIGFLVSGGLSPVTDQSLLVLFLGSEVATVFVYYAGISLLTFEVMMILWYHDTGIIERTYRHSLDEYPRWATVLFWCLMGMATAVVVGTGGAVAALLHQAGFTALAAVLAVLVPIIERANGTLRGVALAASVVSTGVLFVLILGVRLAGGVLTHPSRTMEQTVETVTAAIELVPQAAGDLAQVGSK